MNHDKDFLHLAAEARQRIREISPQEASQLAENGAILIDVRDTAEFEQDHIEAAMHMPVDVSALEVQALISDKSTTILSDPPVRRNQ